LEACETSSNNQSGMIWGVTAGTIQRGVRGGAVSWGTALQAGRSRIRFRWFLWNFLRHNPSGRTLVLWSTQPLTEMSTRNISWE